MRFLILGILLGTASFVTCAAAPAALVDRSSCVAFMRKILSSQEVHHAAKVSCRRFRPQADDKECERYAAETQVAAEEAEAAKVCEKLAVGPSDHVGHDSGEHHFVNSCVQYASNVIAEHASSTAQQSKALKEEVVGKCKTHLVANQMSFCQTYSELISSHASRSKLAVFCTAQYRSMHPSAASLAKAAHAPDHLQSAVAPSVSHDVSARALAAPNHTEVPKEAETLRAQPSQTGCENHLRGLQQLEISLQKKELIVQKDCLERYGASLQTCADMSHRLMLGDVVAACHLVMQQSHHDGPDMMKMCAQTMDQVHALDLKGAALDEAAADICVEELSRESGVKFTSVNIAHGCSFFAKRLSLASSNGPVDKTAFCGSLSASTPQRASQQQSSYFAPHKTGSRSKPSLFAKAPSKKASTNVTASSSDTEFLNSFLSQYDSDQQKKEPSADKGDAILDALDTPASSSSLDEAVNASIAGVDQSEALSGDKGDEILKDSEAPAHAAEEHHATPVSRNRHSSPQKHRGMTDMKKQTSTATIDATADSSDSQEDSDDKKTDDPSADAGDKILDSLDVQVGAETKEAEEPSADKGDLDTPAHAADRHHATSLSSHPHSSPRQGGDVSDVEKQTSTATFDAAVVSSDSHEDANGKRTDDFSADAGDEILDSLDSQMIAETNKVEEPSAEKGDEILDSLDSQAGASDTPTLKTIAKHNYAKSDASGIHAKGAETAVMREDTAMESSDSGSGDVSKKAGGSLADSGDALLDSLDTQLSATDKAKTSKTADKGGAVIDSLASQGTIDKSARHSAAEKHESSVTPPNAPAGKDAKKSEDSLADAGDSLLDSLDSQMGADSQKTEDTSAATAEALPSSAPLKPSPAPVSAEQADAGNGDVDDMVSAFLQRKD